MFKATQDLNFNYNSKIDTSPYHFVTGQHIDMKFFAECYMFIPFKDRIGKESFPIASSALSVSRILVHYHTHADIHCHSMV